MPRLNALSYALSQCSVPTSYFVTPFCSPTLMPDVLQCPTPYRSTPSYNLIVHRHKKNGLIITRTRPTRCTYTAHPRHARHVLCIPLVIPRYSLLILVFPCLSALLPLFPLLPQYPRDARGFLLQRCKYSFCGIFGQPSCSLPLRFCSCGSILRPTLTALFLRLGFCGLAYGASLWVYPYSLALAACPYCLAFTISL